MAALLLTVFCVVAPAVQAAAARPVQTFYVPLPEEQVRAPLYAISTATGMTLRSVIGVSVTADGTLIYYDQWENGYELDIANPRDVWSAGNLGGTQIWGDGNAANGAPPNVPSDLLDAGTIIVLENDITLPRNPAQIKYDGRDKLAATHIVAVTRSAWGKEPGTVLTDAVEVYDTTRWGTSFKIPVGQNLSSSSMFEYVSLAVMAAQNGTAIKIDQDGNGSDDINVTLNQGESYQVAGGINSNAGVTANKPVQVNVISGDVGSTYESRWFTIPPTEQWGPSYYTPFGTTDTVYPANVWLYNPNTSSLTINYETKLGTGSVAVAAGDTYRFLMPALSGAHFWSSGSPFLAVGTMDSSTTGTDQSFDWGYTLVADAWLTTGLVLGWAPGTDTTVACTAGTCNGSPAWVTAMGATTVYVDYDGNPDTGPLVDSEGHHYDVAYALARLESRQITDPDRDQTGMRLYTLDGVPIAGAWGEDPSQARPGNPYLDMGYTIPPLPQATLQKRVGLAVDGNGNGLVEPGDTLAYTVTLRNTGVQTLFDVTLSDALPAHTSYVAGSTTLNGSPVADNGAPATPYPLDEGGLQIGPILVGGSGVVSFRVATNSFPPIYASVANTAIAVSDAGVLTATVTTAVNTGNATACGLSFTDGGGAGVSFYVENGVAYVRVSDGDKNTNAGAIETVTALVQDETTGDYETITLTETGVNTGVFRGSLPTSITAGQAVEDGTLYARGGETLLASYTDPVYSDVCNDTAVITLPSQTKALYLTEPGQGLDRVDPVATGDSTTAASIALGTSTATIAVDNSASALNAAAVATIAVDNSASAVNDAAPLAVDNTSQGTLNNASSTSFSHTTGTGANRLMLVGVSCQQPGASITALTYNGVSLTKVGNLSHSSQTRIEIWRLIAPASGAHTVAVTNSGSDNCVIGVMTFTGVHQTTPLGTFASAQGSSTTASVTASSATGELVLGVAAFNNGDTDLTPGSGQTEYWDNTVNSSIAGAGGTKAGASSVTMSWTNDSSTSWTMGAVPIKPAGTGSSTAGVTIPSFTTGSGSNRLMLVGVSIDLNSSSAAVSSVAYGSQALTLVGTATNTGNERMELWRLLNPPSGTANITVTMNGQVHNGIVAGATTFTGVDQTTPLGTFVTNTGTSTAPSVNVTSASGELVFDTVAAGQATTFSAVGAGQTSRWNATDSGDIAGAASTEAGAASVTMSWTSSSVPWAIGAVPIKPSGFATATAGVTIASFTTGSGSNRLMLVGVSIDLNSASAAVSSVAYGSQALTLVGSATNTGNERMELWRLLAPPSGTANITVTMNGQTHNGIVAGVTTFTGVDQSTPLGTFVTATGTSTAPSVNVTSASGELVFAVAAAGQATTFSAVGAGQTSRWNVTDGGDIAGAASTEAGAASVTMSWTSSSVPWAIGGVSLKPAPGAITTTGMAVWYSSSGSATKYNPWNGITFTVSSNTASLGTITQGLQAAAAPTRNEKVVLGIDAFGALQGEVWNGSAWTTIPSGSLGSPGFTHQWAYDAAYEQSSGDALIAFADGANLKYATWNGSSWSSATTVSDYAALSGGNTPKRIALAAKSGSNEIAMVVTENLGKTMAWIWNGSSFGSGATLNSGTGGSNTVSAVAYERQTGRVIVTYGKGWGDAKVYYKVWNGSTWSGEASMTAPSGSYGSSDYPAFTTLASDPNSNRVVLGVTTANSSTPKTWLNLWDGASWSTSVTGTVTAVGSTFPGIAVAFESKSGDALAVFGNASLYYVYYKTWTSAVGWLPVQALGPGVNAVPNVMILESDPNSNQIMLAAQNSSGGLYYARWGGATPFDAPIRLDTNTGGATDYQPFLFLWDEHLAGSGGGGVLSTDFSQAQPMASDFVMPMGGQITVTTYVSATSTLAANPVITATLKANGATFATLTSPTATLISGGPPKIYRLVWSAALGSDTTVATGEAVNLTVTSGVTPTLQILYDSATYPSKVELPTTTVIELDELGVYDAAYPYGSAVSNPYPGQTAYVRVAASDPFGASDIISVTLNVSGTLVALDDSYVVASDAGSKTYEYAWQTPAHDGACPVSATAHEGYEGISDRASRPLTCRSYDTGTPSTTEFTTGSNGLHTAYYAQNEQVCVRTTDADQNLNGGMVETIVDTIVSVGGGDSEVVTLTETGADTGIFVVCIPASATSGGTHNNGTLYAPSGDTLNVTYVDPNDPNDTSGDVAQVAITGASGPGIAVFKWLAAPTDGVAVVGESVRFDVAVINSGDANLVTTALTDTFPSGCLAYTSASIAPSSVAPPTLVWANLGPLASGDSLIISLYFTASAACNPATNQATVSGVTGGGVTVTDGPVTANVITTNPQVTVEKTLLTPPGGTATVGDAVSFRITIINSGATGISVLPLLDNYSNYCLTYVSASPAADGAGGGVAVWNNLGALGVGASTSVVVSFRAAGPCVPALNTAIVSGARDVNGDPLPAAWDDAQLNIVAEPPQAQLVKTLVSPQSGLAYLGEVVTFSVRITNTGPNVLTQLALTDTWASSCMSLTAWGAYPPTAVAAGQAAWNTLTPPEPPVWPGESMTLTLSFRTTAVTITCTNVVTLTGVDQFDQAFGPLTSQASVRVLPAAATVYGHIFEDRNGNGSQGTGEPNLANIQVVITDSVGFTRTATTDASGNYTATVPTGLTTADVVEATLPAGYHQTAGSDPSSVNVPAGSVTNIGDDGYQPLPVTIGDRTCIDNNANSLCDASDLGVVGIPLRVTGRDVFGASLDITVTTSITGFYLLDTLAPGVYTVTARDAGGFRLVSNPVLTTTLTVGGGSDLGLDFIYAMPTGVQISAPTAVVRANTVRLDWQVLLNGRAAPQFHVWRSAGGNAWKRLTAAALTPVSSTPETAVYSFDDSAVERGMTYAYRLESTAGESYGPWQVCVPAAGDVRSFLPLVGR